MVEQYIYSRSNSGFVNRRSEAISLGYGFVAASPGLDSKTKKDLDVHCAKYTNETVVDDKGQLVQVWRKALLPGNKMVLQNNVSIEETGLRGFHVAHGYVVPMADSDAAAPEKWFGLPYHVTDPNLVEGGILLDSLDSLPGAFSPLPLATVLNAFRLSAAAFSQLVKACFAVLDGRRQVMIPFDFTLPDARELQRQLLYWIYLFLPLQFRRQIGFDSVYSPGSGPRTVQIVFVSRTMLQANGSQLSVRMGREAIALGGNYVLENGAVYHGGKPWEAPDGLFARWISAAIDAAYQSGQVPGAVNTVYETFDKQMAAAGLQTAQELPLYDALCWSALLSGKAKTLGGVRVDVTASPEEAQACRMTVLARMGNSGAIGAALVEILKNHQTPTTPDEIKMLATALHSSAAKEVEWALGAFMAGDLDANPQQQERILHQYSTLLPKDCYDGLLAWVLIKGAPADAESLWRKVEADASARAAERRRSIWYQSQIPQSAQLNELPGRILDTVDKLPCETAEMHTELTRELVQGIRLQVKRSIPQSTMLQIVGTANALRQQWDRPDAGQCISILETLVQNYTAKPEEATLARLDTVEQTFKPLAGSARAREIETKLYKCELEQLFSAQTPFEPTEEMFAQMLKVSGRLDEFYDYSRTSELRMALYDRAFSALLVQPPVFLNANWLKNALQNMPADPGSLPDSIRAGQLLAAFCGGTVQTMGQWRKLQLQYELPDTAYRLAFNALPQLYLNGALPRIRAGFIMLLIHRRPEHIDLILERTVRQGGSPLLLEVIRYASRYQRRLVIRNKESNDLRALLGNVCSRPLLDQMLQADGAPYFDAEVIKMLPGLAANESMALQDARYVGQRLWSHYEENAKGAGRHSIKKIVDKLTNG